MLNSIEQLKKNIEAFIQAKHQLLDNADHLSLFDMAAEAVVERCAHGGRINNLCECVESASFG